MANLLTTFAAQITSAGITAPAFEDILYTLQQQFGGIYGSDITTDPSTQDMQWLAILAQGYYDCAQSQVATYNAYRPGGAQGAGLSSIVKINGIARLVPTNSTAQLTIVGQNGTIITNGIASDGTYYWNLPSSVTIPASGTISVTATCQTQGSITASIGAISIIFTPTPGWQTVTNPASATVGNPVETDAQLTARQAVSTSISALAILDGIVAAVENISGVTAVMAYENDTNSTNSIGLPPHSISLVVEGGTSTAIANAIALKKDPGTYTYGTTSVAVTSASGVPNTIQFYYATNVQTYALITINPLTGYVSTTGTAILAALAQYITSTTIGQEIYYNKLYGPVNLYGDAATTATGQTQAALDLLSQTYNLTSLYIARSDMTVTSTITAGATSLVIGNPNSLSVGNTIVLTNSDASQSTNVITGISGSTITFTPAVATGKTVNAASLVYANGNLATAFNENPSAVVGNFTLVT